VVPALAVWLAIDLDASLIGFNAVQLLVNTALLNGSGISNSILVLTYPLVIASVGGTWWVLRNLGAWRATLVAITVPFGWLMAFEIPWHVLGEYSPGFPHPIARPGWIVLAAWTLVGATSFPYWRATRTFLVLAGVFALLWGAWFAIGFPQIGGGSAVALAFNLILKGWAFLTFIALIWRRETTSVTLSGVAPAPAREEGTSTPGATAAPD